MKLLLKSLAAAFFAFSLPALAATAPGEPIPHQLEVLDQKGALQSFESVKGEKGAVLVFVRSADWCPYCQRQLIEISGAQAQIEKLGYNVVSISYDTPDKLEKFALKRDIQYTMLSDQGSEIIRAFGILNEDVKPGSRAYGVPNPAIYIVGADGTVRAMLAEESYKKRPPAEKIIETIKALPAS